MNAPASNPNERPLAAIILAAGKGKRMGSDPRMPKVAHVVAGRPIVWWVVDACRAAGCAPLTLVVGHGADSVRDIFSGDDTDIEFVVQDKQLGTGHAVLCAEPELQEFDGDVVVLAGDGPLIREETIRTMIERHRSTHAAATLATSIIKDPTGYGRIVRDASGGFEAIVEHKSATDAQRKIHEIYPSYACFDAQQMFAMLRKLEPNALTGEYYVTDLPAMMKAARRRVEIVDAVPPEDVLSINTPAELAEVDRILSARVGVPR